MGQAKFTETKLKPDASFAAVGVLVSRHALPAKAEWWNRSGDAEALPLRTSL